MNVDEVNTVCLIIGIICGLSLALYYLRPVDEWLKSRDKVREFWRLYDCKNLAYDPEWRQKIAEEVARKLKILKDCVSIFGGELVVMDNRILSFKPHGDIIDEESEEGILLKRGLENLYQQKRDMIARLRFAEETFEKACDLAVHMKYNEEVIACKKSK